MIIYAFGLVTLSPRVYATLMIVAVVTFLAALLRLPGEYTAHYGFMLVAGTLLSVLGFTLRYKTLYRAMRMLNGTRRKSRRLVSASHEIAAQMREVQKANLAKDQFVANVTHELRTPLTGTMGMLDLLRDTKLDGEQAFMVATAQKSSHYLLSVVNDMLALGMIDAGKLELAEDRIDLVEVTKNAVDEFKPEAASKEISLTIGRQPHKEIWVRSDAARLVQILSKLISNAVKFTEEGGVIVSLNWALSSDKKTGQVTWRVADTGPGIPAESIDSMFNRFEQLDRTITRMRSGTGLGLSIVKEVVTLMGGSVEVKSDVDKGAVFKIALDLPIWTDESDEKVAPADGEAEDDDLTRKLNLNVLVAEDNHINQLVILHMLEKLGAEVTMVDNGQLAVEAVEKAKVPFDLIFMDIQMPIMDGLSASKIIKMRSRHLQPIIAVTANTGDHDIQDYEEAGIEAVVGKPIDFNHFRAVILSVLDAQKKRALR